MDLRGGAVEWASKDKSSKKHVLEVRRRRRERLKALIFSESLTRAVSPAAEDSAGHRASDPVGERWRHQRVVPSAAGLHQHPRESQLDPSRSRVHSEVAHGYGVCVSVCAHQAWESDEAIEEDMPESPVEKQDKDKEHRDSKKSRGLSPCKQNPQLC